MSRRRAGPQLARWLVALAASAVLIGLSPGNAFGGAGSSTGITVDTTGGLSVSAAGTWFWSENLTETPTSYLGWALDWGDVTSGNSVPKPGGGAYHIGDGTAGTNLVQQPIEPANGSSGTWGPSTHTYAAAGTYTVCVIIYDLGPETPFPDTGYHSLVAGGRLRNEDNSVEQNEAVEGNCDTVTVTKPTPTPTVTPSPTPFQTFEGETAAPTEGPTPTPTQPAGIATPPASSTNGGSSGSGSTPLLGLLICLAFGGLGMMAMAAERRGIRR